MQVMTGSEFDFKPGAQGKLSPTDSLVPVGDFSGIYWEQVGSFRVPVETQRVINLEIDKQLQKLTRVLDINRPNIIITQTPKGNSKLENDQLARLSADTFISDDIPNGLMHIYTPTIEDIIAEMNNGYNRSSLIIPANVGHECFHVWQWKMNREAVEKDVAMSKLPGRDILGENWNNTLTERYAVWFERFWIENWMDFPKAGK